MTLLTVLLVGPLRRTPHSPREIGPLAEVLCDSCWRLALGQPGLRSYDVGGCFQYHVFAAEEVAYNLDRVTQKLRIVAVMPSKMASFVCLCLWSAHLQTAGHGEGETEEELPLHFFHPFQPPKQNQYH